MTLIASPMEAYFALMDWPLWGKNKSCNRRYFPDVDFSLSASGELTKFCRGGNVKEPATLPSSTSLKTFSLATDALAFTVNALLASLEDLMSLYPIPNPYVNAST